MTSGLVISTPISSPAVLATRRSFGSRATPMPRVPPGTKWECCVPV